MSTVTFGGHVGSEPQDIANRKGVRVRVAENYYSRRNQERDTRWWTVAIFGKRADFVRQYVGKGDVVHVVAELEQPRPKDDGHEVWLDCVASTFDKLKGADRGATGSSRGSQRGGGQRRQGRGGYDPGGPDVPDVFADDDIPFDF